MLQDKMIGRSLRALAREAGISAAYLSDIIRGQRSAGPKVLDFLGLERIVGARRNIQYRKIARTRA